MSRILIIEDDPAVRSLLKEALIEAGHQTLEAENGKEGLEVFHQSPADLVVCDIFMPEMEGIETIHELHKGAPDVRILAISGGGSSGNTDALAAAAKLGAHGTLAKPFSVDEFLGAVDNALGAA